MESLVGAAVSIFVLSTIIYIIVTQVQDERKSGVIKETDCKPFMLGIVLLSGLVGIPLCYCRDTYLNYFEALPLTLISSVAILIVFKRNHTCSVWQVVVPLFTIMMLIIFFDFARETTSASQ